MGQTYEIDQERLYKLFKRIVDDKFSELTYRDKPWWQTHEDDVEWVTTIQRLRIFNSEKLLLVFYEYDANIL